MVVGYLLLAALWYFVFRRSPAEREADEAVEAARAEAVRTMAPGHRPARPDREGAGRGAERRRRAARSPSPLRIERHRAALPPPLSPEPTPRGKERS